MILHYREVGDICYVFHHGATIYAFYFVMVSYRVAVSNYISHEA